MAKQTMEEKVKGLLDAKDVVFDHTEGNTHFFMGKQHSNGVNDPYVITAEIREKELDWECSCKAFEFADTCKHIECAKELLIRLELRTEYDARLTSNEDKHYHDDDEVVTKIKIESDDD